jgi:hypothetical protein
MFWTRELPKAFGWYWRRIDGSPDEIVLIERDGKEAVVRFSGTHVSLELHEFDSSSEWSGPIRHPVDSIPF